MSKETPEVDTSANQAPEQPTAVTSAADFKKQSEARKAGVMLTLPSGAVVRVGRPSVNKLIAAGHVPSDVAAVIMQGGNKNASNLGAKEFAKLVELQRIVTLHAVIEPKVVDGEANYDEGEISIEDLTDDDQSAILIYVQSGVTDLSKFRSERSS